jgi:serine/threonine protein kinase
VQPDTIGKFVGSNNWKLLDMRRTTKIGENMRGELRSGVPPESVKSSAIGYSASTDRMKSISFDEEFKRTKPVNYNVSFDDAGPDIEFAPESVVADPSWDIWAFGLVMGQLILGQSMVQLPNFEKASDAHLKNLYQYDYEKLKKIHRASLKIAGQKSANLLSKCLQPIPDERPKSMSEILNDPYFEDINKIV